MADNLSDGIPLLTRVLLVRATASFDPSLPNDGHRPPCSPSSSSSHPTRSLTAYAAPLYTSVDAAHVRPRLRIVAHYAQSEDKSTVAGLSFLLRESTDTPDDDANFFAVHASLKQLLTSLAADRLREKIKLRQIQSVIARTAVKLVRASAEPATATAAVIESPDAASFFSSSTTTSMNNEDTPRETGSNSGSSSNNSNKQQLQVQGILAAATATFAEDAAWRSLTKPYQPQLNPWSLTPVSDEGCYLSFPSPSYVHWCQVQAARCCSTSDPDANSTESAVQGGPLPYTDVVHYTSVGKNSGDKDSSSSDREELGYVHGYAFVLDGAVFSGSSEHREAAPTTEGGPFSEDDGEVSVLLWCVLSDAPVFNFMRALTLETVAAMSYVAQRVFHSATESATAETVAASSSSSSRDAKLGMSVRADVYAALLDSVLDEEVVRPLATELVHHGSLSSRTLPGKSFTVNLLPTREGSPSGVTSVRPQMLAMSGTLTFRRPLDLLFPFSDVPLSVLLLSFGEDALRVLQSLLFQEERVVVVGATPQHASACVVSLLSLIAPFTWVSPVVPYLPPHTAAETGLLYILLSAPYATVQQQQQQRRESAGFLLGSTAAIRPYLMFLSSFGVVAGRGGEGEGGGNGNQGPCSGRLPRVWIADARTGAVGVCPREPISPYTRADPKAHYKSVVGNNSSDVHISVGRSCTAHGGASPWTLSAHIDLRIAVPQFYASSTKSPPKGSSRNLYVLYNAVRNTLRTAAARNVMEAAQLNMLPHFHNELCDTLRRVAPPEKRRQFRRALEELTQHTHVRMDNLASLAARLIRGLRQTLKATAAISVGAEHFSSDDSGSDSCSEENVVNTEDAFQLDEKVSFRAVTEARAQFQSFAFPDASTSNSPTQFPTFSSGETWQVQSGFLGYVVERLAGAYRRGITVVNNAVSNHCGGGGGRKHRFMQASIFLVPGLDQHYMLAETIARTHLFRQFECAVLAAEACGLQRVLGGCGLHTYNNSNEVAGLSVECHAMLKYVRPLALFAVLCDRARLQFPELYADVPGLDAVGTVYTTVVKRHFTKRPGPPANVSVPPAIRSIAGSSASSDLSRADGISSSSGPYTGNSGGGFRSFFTKAAKAMKLHSGNNNSSGGMGGGGGGRGLPVLYLPASIACLNSFAVAPFSAQHVAPESFHITTYDCNATDCTSRRGNNEQRGQHPHHRHRRPRLHLHRHGKEKKDARRRRDQHMADLCAIPVKLQRQQWVRQQQHQQCSAISIDFTLDDCTNVVRNDYVPGGGSSSLVSSNLSTSTGTAASAAASHSNVYVSGVGLDVEMLTSLTRTGGARGGGGADAAVQAMAEASLSICHALPFDVVHQFDAYEPLLAPVLTSSSVSKEEERSDFTGSVAYMGVGLLCPSCVNVWCEGEERATRVLLRQEQRQLSIQKPKSSSSSPPPPQQAQQGSSSQLPPMPVKQVSASTPLDVQSWSTSPPISSAPSPLQTESAVPVTVPAATTAGGSPPTSSWGTFTSGVPLGFPIDNTPRNLQASSNYGKRTNTSMMLPSVEWGSASASPSAKPAASAHQDVCDNWGMQAPVVINPSPTTTAAATATAAAVSPSTTTLPVAVPAPGNVMDELFAGLSNYSNRGNNTQGTSQPPPPRRPTLDDFF